MKSHKASVFLICIYLSIAAIIISFLLGPSGDAPRTTISTYIAGFVLLVFEFLYVKEKFSWGILKATGVELVSLVPQFLVLLIGTFLWFISLPILLALIVVQLMKWHKHQ